MSKMKKNWLWVVAIVCLTLNLTVIPALGDTSTTHKWKFGQPYPKGTMEYDRAELLIKRIQDASNGRITITHYPGDLLGDFIKQAEAVSAGAQQMCITWITTSVAGPGSDLALMGYVVNDFKAYKEGTVGYMLDIINQVCSKAANWKITGAVPDGFSCIVTTKKFNPMPGPKDLKIRVVSSQTAQSRYKAMGFHTVNIPYSEIVSAVQLGTVQGSGNTAWTEAWNKYRDVVKYVYDFRDMASAAHVIINGTSFKSLSTQDQTMVQRVCKEWSEEYFGLIQDVNEKTKKKLIDHGLEVIPFDIKVWKANARVARPAEWSLMKKDLGKDLFGLVEANASSID